MKTIQVKSKMWTLLASQNIKLNGYNYDDQKMFLKEAREVIKCYSKLYNTLFLTYENEEETKAKALWMIGINGLLISDSIIFLMESKKFKLVPSSCRELMESTDLGLLFLEKDNKINKRYTGKIVRHKEYREILGKDHSEKKNQAYKDLSHYSHCAYYNQRDMYCIGGNDTGTKMYACLGEYENCLPSPVYSHYFPVFASLILELSEFTKKSKLFSDDNLLNIEILEKAYLPPKIWTS